MSLYIKHIRNPKSLNMKYWYLKRRYHSEWLYDIPTHNSLVRYLDTDDQRRTELFLQFEAIEDLYHYIRAADRSRRFAFQLLENDKDRYYFGIFNSNDTWWFIKKERNGNGISRRIRKKLTYRRLYNLVNFPYDAYVIGFRLLECLSN